MTCAARSSSDGGIVRPSVFAVVKLTTQIARDVLMSAVSGRRRGGTLARQAARLLTAEGACPRPQIEVSHVRHLLAVESTQSLHGKPSRSRTRILTRCQQRRC